MKIKDFLSCGLDLDNLFRYCPDKQDGTWCGMDHLLWNTSQKMFIHYTFTGSHH